MSNPIINEWIIAKFPKTEDAILVQKWFGTDLNSFFHQVVAEGKKEGLLAMAKKQEGEEKKA